MTLCANCVCIFELFCVLHGAGVARVDPAAREYHRPVDGGRHGRAGVCTLYGMTLLL